MIQEADCMVSLFSFYAGPARNEGRGSSAADMNRKDIHKMMQVIYLKIAKFAQIGD